MNRKAGISIVSFLSVVIIAVFFALCTSAAGVSVGTVTDLKATQTSDTLTLSWKKADNASGYRIMEKVNGKWVLHGTTKSTAYIVTDLSSAKSHTFGVRAFTKLNNKTVWSEKSQRITTCTKPANVKNLKFETKGTSLQLTWNKTSGATGYRVYKYDSAKEKWNKINDTKQNTVKISNLNPGGKYIFAVKAYCKKSGTTLFSEKYSKITVIIPPSAPESVWVSATGNTVNLFWSPSAKATGYRVYKYDYITKKWTTVIKNVSGCSATVYDLQQNVKYRFSVRAIVSYGGQNVLSETGKRVTVTTSDNVTTAPPTTVPVGKTPVKVSTGSSAFSSKGILVVDIDGSDWDSPFVSNTQYLPVNVDGQPTGKTVKCTVNSKPDAAGNYCITVDASGLSLKSGANISIAFPEGFIQTKSGTQYSRAFVVYATY